MRNRRAYPKGWRRLALACKIRAGWKCEKCGVSHGALRRSVWTGRLWPVYLQAAHVCHDQANESPDLVCCCPTCHWRYYRRPGQLLTHGQVEARKHRIALERRGYHGPWRP